MANKFTELRSKMPQAAQAQAAALAQVMLAEMPLHELRHAKELSQTQLAEVLHVNQAAISKLERRTDMYISTLRSYIKAMGGDLEIVARFPDGEVKISNFSNQPADVEIME
jgi:DNA-binding transcriptional regulator YiaG